MVHAVPHLDNTRFPSVTERCDPGTLYLRLIAEAGGSLGILDERNLAASLCLEPTTCSPKYCIMGLILR
jgi:hypothetical protein